MAANNFNIQGLAPQQVLDARAKFGYNSLEYKKESKIWNVIKSLAKEPMVILLMVASAVYFISGNTGDGIFLGSAIVVVSTISLYQDSRSRNALEKLNRLHTPSAK